MDVFVSIISSAVITSLVYLAGRLAGGGFRLSDKEIVLQNSRRDRGIAILAVFFVPFFGIMYLLNGGVSEQGDIKWVLYITTSVVCLIMLLFAIHTLSHSIIMNEEGIQIRGLLESGPRAIKWANVARVFQKHLAGVTVENREGQQMTIEKGHQGYQLFVEECRRRLSPEVYGKVFG